MINDISFILLILSSLIMLCFLFVVLRMKNKTTLHWFSIINVFIIFLWGILSIANEYVVKNDHSDEILTNLIYSVISFVPYFLFFFGYVYAKSDSKINKVLYLLILLPVIRIVLIWTNEYHHLLFTNSIISGERVRSPLSFYYMIASYIMDVLGFFYLVKFSVKNSGFFSKQSMLIMIGILFPFVVDVIFFFNIIPIPHYYEPIAFSIAIVFFLAAILRFGLFSIIPIALQTVVDHISDSYIVINEKFVIIDFNRSFSEGFKDAVTIARKDSLREMFNQLEYISFISYDGFVEFINEGIRTKKSVSFENHFLSDRIDRTYTIEITPIYAENTYKGTIILLKDITEQRKSFEMIRQAQVMLIESEHLASLGQLVGGIAHNLKTPIMSISGGLEGLSDLITEYDESVGDDGITDEDHHEIANDMRVWIGKMKEYCSYMSDIITTVKGQAVQFTAATTDKFLLRELTKRVDILMNHELKKYGCRLELICADEDTIEIKGEVNSLVQVINNLIINSIEAYEGKEGAIDFIITREDDMIQFIVKDYASGMTDDVKNKLFKEMITTKAKFGTGLGLYMSYSTICGRFGGKMWFESELGKGTAFYVQVPAV
jgi:two-component system sensor histidine kinase HupT/HoxJ